MHQSVSRTVPVSYTHLKGVLLMSGKPDELKQQFNASNLEEVFERAVEQA